MCGAGNSRWMGVVCAGVLWASTACAEEGQAPKSANPHFDPKAIWAVPMTKAGSTKGTERTGEDWPMFLGPREDGISGETG